MSCLNHFVSVKNAITHNCIVSVDADKHAPANKLRVRYCACIGPVSLSRVVPEAEHRHTARQHCAA